MQRTGSGEAAAGTIWLVLPDRERAAWIEDAVAPLGARVHVYARAEEFRREFDDEQCGCVIVDAVLPDATGCELMCELGGRHDHPPFVFVSGLGELPVAVEAFKGGAFDFFEVPLSAHELTQSVRQALSDDRAWRGRRLERRDFRTHREDLTQREVEVFEGLLEGRMSKVIASELGISKKTVDLHRSNILHKFGVGSATELIVLASRLCFGARCT